MSKIYTVVRQTSRRNTVRVHFLDEGWTQINDYNQWVQEVIDQMVLWCSQHECGQRVSYDMFSFRSEKELSMFLLKWQ